MYKRILLPTDGSSLSRQAVQSGVHFARESGAQVVGLHVVALPHADQLDAWVHHEPHLVERRQALFDKFAEEYLAFVADTARAEQVPCTTHKVSETEPSRAIVRTAHELNCDLIFMASHGWKGDMARMPGSETLKVLQDSHVPVMVHKPAQPREGQP
jgi:nucleotide-binding universal stress UspA family protein